MIDRIKLNRHWYGFLPPKIQYYIAKIGIRLGIIRKYGKLTVTVNSPNGKSKTVHGYNIITNDGIKALNTVLGGTETTNTKIAFIEPGKSDTTPTINNTDIGSGLTPVDRVAITTVTQGSSSPFALVFEAFLSSTKYTRSQTIKELAIYFGPDESGKMFARGVLGTAITLGNNATATLTYGLVFR